MTIEKKYKNISLTLFLELLTNNHFFWIVKRLSGNDTGITGGHQSGIYVPREFMKAVIPSVVTTEHYNPTEEISCYIPSQDCFKNGIQAKYYNNKFFPERNLKKEYNEFRLTRWSKTPLQETANTGTICILAGKRTTNGPTLLCWVCNTEEEENIIEQWLGKDVEPGQIYLSNVSKASKNFKLLKPYPHSWVRSFPSGRAIFKYVEECLPQNKRTSSIDALLIKRREYEFNVFSDIERKDVLPHIKKGFNSVETFFKYANSISNRRKSRAGTSLELHLESIFKYEQLRFEMQVITEQRKRPDFIFPTGKDYHNQEFPIDHLHMLAAKTCCKDRWRQVVLEADRIAKKHLFTLQEGISSNQLAEMTEHGIVLVIPQKNFKFFPMEYRSRIMNLSGFVNFIKESQTAG